MIFVFTSARAAPTSASAAAAAVRIVLFMLSSASVAFGRRRERPADRLARGLALELRHLVPGSGRLRARLRRPGLRAGIPRPHCDRLGLLRLVLGVTGALLGVGDGLRIRRGAVRGGTDRE